MISYALLDADLFAVKWTSTDDPLGPEVPDGLTAVEVPDRRPPKVPYIGARLKVIEGAYVWVDTRTLGALKADKIQSLAAAWKAELHGGITIGGKVAPTTPDAWVDYLTLRQMATEGDWTDQPIQLVDGSFELITQAKAQALWAALKAQRRTLMEKLRDKVLLVQAATTAEEVNAITWT